jgi:hypothetical protein
MGIPPITNPLERAGFLCVRGILVSFSIWADKINPDMGSTGLEPVTLCK